MTKMTDIFKQRCCEIDQFGSAYPHRYAPSSDINSIQEFILKFSHIAPGEHLDTTNIAVMGRIYSIREASKNLVFYDLRDQGEKIQVMANVKMYAGDFSKMTTLLKIGDFIGVDGIPGKSKRGELSIFPKEMTLLAPCLRQFPKLSYIDEDGVERNGLKDHDTRFKQRYLDLLLNDSVRRIFITRSKIITFIRKFLNDRDFLEVDTPILNLTVGGANAKPFITKSNDLNCEMFMRIAPELYLKQLVIGGLPRVYEIGRQFRNESNDVTHNCEFTSMEYYMRNADADILMEQCEAMIHGLVTCITGTHLLKYQNKVFDFSIPFKRIDICEELTRHIGSLPDDLGSDSSREILQKKCDEFGVVCSHPRTNARLLDKLIGHFIEPQCDNPTFVINHPLVMSPLAKWHRHNPNLSERFELFVNQFEIANAYTELNDPQVQRKQFDLQGKDRSAGDDEAQVPDQVFLTAMEYGLPPTGGFGCGIDRLCMLLSDVSTIREVILFPTMR